MNIEKLNLQEFEFFKKIVYDETGIKLSEMKVALLQSRIMRRMRVLQLNTYAEYKCYLSDFYNEEIINFINAVTTNKTEFLREIKHFDFMRSDVLPEFAAHNKEEIRIWSAGCSTGEEPYTVAITCAEYFKEKLSIPTKILATDIDTQVLTTAYKGIYSSESVKVFPQSVSARYFSRKKVDNGYQYRVNEEIKDTILFRRLNLQDDRYPMKKKFDIIFCRNVIIYFDKETQQRLFVKLYEYLADDGYLFIGHSENLSGIDTSFKSIGHTIYTK